jgi:hypothetical protein
MQILFLDEFGILWNTVPISAQIDELFVYTNFSRHALEFQKNLEKYYIQGNMFCIPTKRFKPKFIMLTSFIHTHATKIGIYLIHAHL